MITVSSAYKVSDLFPFDVTKLCYHNLAIRPGFTQINTILSKIFLYKIHKGISYISEKSRRCSVSGKQALSIL